MYGYFAGRYEIFPHQTIDFFKTSAFDVLRDYRVLLGLKPEHFLGEARYDGDGVTRFEAGREAPGLTLVSGYYDGDNGLRLLRLDGSLVRHWPVRFSELFPNPGHIRPSSEIPVTDWNIDLHGAMALPDGSVVFNFEYGGLVKLDRCGAVRWVVPRMTHHSIDRSADGGFWVAGRHYVDDASAFPKVDAPYFEDTILKISADGEVLKEISVPGLLFKNNLQSLLFANGVHWLELAGELEIVHLNDVEELSGELADRFPGFSAGDLLLSLRDLNLVMVIDPQSEAVRWYKTGPWIRQHDPDFQANGTITLFNNNSDDTRTGSIFGGSNITEVNPIDNQTKLLYGGQSDQLFFSNIRGKHQLLDNGDLLITEFSAGRVFEVDPDGDVVWEFISRYDEDETAEIADAIRYPENYFTVTDWSCD